MIKKLVVSFHSLNIDQIKTRQRWQLQKTHAKRILLFIPLPSLLPFVLQAFFTSLRGYKSARSMQRSGCTVANRRVSLLLCHYQRYGRRFWVVISSNPSNGVVYLNFYTALALFSLSLSVRYLYAIIVFTPPTIEIHTPCQNDDQSNLSTIKIVHFDRSSLTIS